MTAEEIFAGESENIEFKSEIPVKSEKYMKTVVAFANGKGGKLVFGVENGTWTVTGFSKEEVFQKMDAITNINPEIVEAAIVDGANRAQRIWYITLPELSVTIVTLLILQIGNVMNAGFDQIFNFYNPLVYSTADRGAAYRG